MSSRAMIAGSLAASGKFDFEVKKSNLELSEIAST